MKEGCLCFSEREALIKLICVLPHPALLFSFSSFLLPYLLSFPISSSPPSSLPFFPNRDTSKGEQVSQNGLPAEQGSPRVSYRSQTYQNYKNFNSLGVSCLTEMLLFSSHPFDSYLFSTYYNHVGSLSVNKPLILNRMEVESNFHTRSLFSGLGCFLFAQEVLA